jgi:hypothetical protein
MESHNQENSALHNAGFAQESDTGDTHNPSASSIKGGEHGDVDAHGGARGDADLSAAKRGGKQGDASGTTTELAIASTEDEAVNLEPTFYGSKTPPHQVTCCGLAVEDHLSSSGDKGAAGERAARERAAGTKRAARERAATAARAAGISTPSGVVVAHARPLRRKQRGVDEDALEEAISRGAMPRELPTVNPRLNVKSIKQGNEFYLRSAQDSVVHITVVRHGVDTGQHVKIVETRAYSRLELQREIFELERHVDELLKPTVRSFTSPDLALKQVAVRHSAYSVPHSLSLFPSPY